MQIQPGQTYRSADPRELIRIRIKTYTPGENRALVVDAATGQRPRPMLVTALHSSPTTRSGKPRRSGYILEQSETPAARQTTGQDDTEPAYYGVNGCTCRAWTRVGGTPRFLRGDESVELIGGWEEQPDCPHHAPAVGQPAEAHDTDARPPRVQWRVEGYDAGEWNPVSRTFSTSEEAHLWRRAIRCYPDMPTRLVRETTTWAVEDETAPAPEQLVPVGWWCWRGNDHGHLAHTACRSDNVPLHVPAEWADDMRAVIQHLTDDHDPGDDCTWVTPEEQAAETLAAADTMEDETR